MIINAHLTLAILVATFGLLIKTKLPAACIFMAALATAITLKLAPAQELLKGFSNQGMLTVAVLDLPVRLCVTRGPKRVAHQAK